MDREMVYSGYEWLGDIPEDWTTCRTKNMFNFGKGLSITKDNLVGTGTPVISYGQVHSKMNSGTALCNELIRFVSEEYLETNPESLVEENDFIFADTSEDFDGCGNCVFVDRSMRLFAGYHTIILRANNSAENKYFAYLFKTDAWRSQIRSKVSGVKVFSISRKILADTVLIVPSECDQRRIVDYLDCKCAVIDAVISKTNATIEEYKKLKQSIIAEAVTKGIQHNRQMKPSGVAWTQKIPGNWSVIPSKYVFHNSDERKHEGDVLLTSSQKHGIISQTEYMERENAKVVLANKGLEDWKHVEPYDFVISLRSFQGGLEMSETTGCITWHYIVLKPCREICSDYYKWLFKSEVYIKALQRTCNFIRDGQDLRYSNFVQVPLVVPPIAEQKEIADYLDKKCAEIDTLISKKTALLEELENYKKSIIFEYVTGKKEVQ